MFYLNLINKPWTWIILLGLHGIGYWGILKKMGLKQTWALIPFYAEKKIGDTMFQSPYAFRHPFLLAVLFAAIGFYYNPFAERAANLTRLIGYLYFFLAYVNYCGYLFRLYWRMGKSFGQGILFRIGMILLPFPFLLALGWLKQLPFLHGTPIRLSRLRPAKWMWPFITFGGVLTFLGEFAAIAFASFFIILQTNLPRPLSALILKEGYDDTKNVVSDNSEVTRKETMGDAYASLSSMMPSREKFVSNEGAESVVVMEYVIGSDLEYRNGAASLNIMQMKDATKQGSGLTFVMEAGGSFRWFTDGIKDSSVGRYTVKDGKVELVQELDSYTSMVNPSSLSDFIQWTKANYPADRYMLVLWDHGGGIGGGYGSDALNKRNEGEGSGLRIDEIVAAVRDSGVKFDMIGFDACLMQDIEIAVALEPYADYYLASEESEPGSGWTYTSGFSMLAKDPSTPTEAFGAEMIGSYDPYNKAYMSGKEPDNFTLSMVDLTYVKPAYEILNTLFDKQREAIRERESDYVDISSTAKNSYIFGNDEQIDLIHYLDLLKKADYDDSICADEEIDDVINAVRASVVARNRRTAEGINGIALTFPFKSVVNYNSDWKQFRSLNLKEQENFYNNYFSIMAASQSLGSSIEIFGITIDTDYSDEEWYVKGYENYVTTPPMIDIPIVQNENGYSLELSDKIWDIIIDAKQFYYKKTDQGLQYLGMDYVGAEDEAGHPMITTDGTWISIGKQPIYYEPTGERETENGTVFTGISKAMLNKKSEVILHIEWDPISEDGTSPAKGTVIGYDLLDDEDAFMEKGMRTLEPGETLDFLFDFYDEEGKLIKTETSGSTYRVIKPENVTVSDQSLGKCTLQHGIVLTDAYQRKFQTQMVETEVN